MGSSRLLVMDLDDTLVAGNYYETSDALLPNPDLVRVLQSYLRDCATHVAIVTGRDPESLYDTTAWLRQHVLDPDAPVPTLLLCGSDPAGWWHGKIQAVLSLFDEHKPREFIVYDDNRTLLAAYAELIGPDVPYARFYHVEGSNLTEYAAQDLTRLYGPDAPAGAQ